MLQSILEEAVQKGEKIIPEHSSGEPDRSLSKIIDEIFDLILANPHYWKLIMALSLHEDIKQRFQYIIRPNQEKNLNFLIDRLERKGVPDARLEALALSALLDGVLLQYIYMGDRYPMREMKEFLIRKFQEHD